MHPQDTPNPTCIECETHSIGRRSVTGLCRACGCKRRVFARRNNDPIVIDGDVAYVPLSSGKVAIIDASDAETVGGFNWWAMESKKTKTFYAARTCNRKKIYLHRFIMDAREGELVDHWNRNGLDNRRKNLRVCTVTDNAANAKVRSDNSSGFKGVRRQGAKWLAYIRCEGRQVSIGRYETPEEAAKAYDVTAKETFGSFALLNFPG